MGDGAGRGSQLAELTAASCIRLFVCYPQDAKEEEEKKAAEEKRKAEEKAAAEKKAAAGEDKVGGWVGLLGCWI